ncbi:PREDICTED: Golgi-specific brefeldin A-resistance guanine nucleotide exchange factor 1-like [Amphimedon queenslandica]|uniref:Mon2/Sec7/BIG1-like HUS domain-containing protein n=1 Tax=Amphimedon queenslandica TaxID=400682 RepID=A0A1X7SPL6_AMPQE|nr:PREDICTED: Golgi-specific brefeldin A-resistance guanine nucleotide exchange factor 1-like [Amphimedon queenslandica]|eukprot:XP_019863191.1 PREDICTED: Golgi-specific brefeldin A-resistance guanine nucleotide exchange factor 1-like [Amphimedon queenslandica]
MPCVREVLRFFISIINPKDRNDKRVICIGLDLVTVMLECGGKSLVDIKSLRVLMQDGLYHHLLALLKHESIDDFGRSLRKCFLFI